MKKSELKQLIREVIKEEIPKRRLNEDWKLEKISEKEVRNINESKQVGILYHHTTVKNVMGILNDNTLKLSQNHDSVSFTRDKNAYKTIAKIYPIRIVVDGNELSNNYKISPYQDYYNSPGITRKIPDEMEEVVLKDIRNIKKYIIRVDVFEDDFYDELTLYNERELLNIFKIEDLNINDFKEIMQKYGVKLNIIERR
jgi:hypothetical protein